MPQKFKDNRHQEWTLSLDLWKAREIRNKTTVDICTEEGCAAIHDSVIDRFAVLYAICEEQAKELKVGPKEFNERIQGGCLREATVALLGECETFYLDHDLPYLSLMAKKLGQHFRRGHEMMESAIASGRIEQEMDKVIEAMTTPHGSGSQQLQPSQEPTLGD